MSRLIDAEELELDTEWSDYYDGFTSYSQSQIDEAEEVKAIPLEKVKQAIEEIEQYLLEEECNGNHEKGIMFALEILKRNIGESKGGYALNTNVGNKKQAEPCEDAVSKEDVIKAIDRHTFNTDDGLCLDEDISIILEELPPVTSTCKKGE